VYQLKQSRATRAAPALADGYRCSPYSNLPTHNAVKRMSSVFFRARSRASFARSR
jgi:hypothetical protein